MKYAAYPVLFLLFCMFFYIPLISVLFPPGGDVGHYLALSYAFEGVNIEGGLNYQPLVPFIVFVVSKISSSVTILLALLKVLGVALLAFLGLSVYSLIKYFFEIDRMLPMIGFILAVTTSLYVEAISWGGYPQLLGIAFAILAFRSLFAYLLNESKKNLLLTSLLVMLTASTHLPSLVFTIISVIVIINIYFYHSRNFKGGVLSTIKIVSCAILLSTPLVPIYYKMQMDYAPLILTITNFGNLFNVVRWIAISSIIPTVTGFSFIFVAVFHGKRFLLSLPALIQILIASSLISALIVFLVSPVNAPERALFFGALGFVLFASFSIKFILDHTWRTRSNIYTKLTVVTIVLVAVSANIFSSYGQHYAAVSWYSRLGDDDLDSFLWLAHNTEPEDRIITIYAREKVPPLHLTHGWWAEGISKRTAYVSMEDISWLMLKSEKERAVLAETVQNGVQVIDGGEMKLIVNPILGYGSPSLFLHSIGFYYPVLWFDDASTIIYVSPNDSSSWTHKKELFYADQKIGPFVDQGSSSLQVSYLYLWAQLDVTKTITVKEGNNYTVSYRLLLNKSTSSGTIFSIFAPYRSKFTSMDLERLSQQFINLQIRNTRIFDRLGEITQILDVSIFSDIRIQDAMLTLEDSRGLSRIDVNFTNEHQADQFNIRFDVSVKGYYFDSVKYYDVYRLMQQNGIKYVLISVYEASDVARRFGEDDKFKLVYVRNNVYIFRLVEATE